jgi:hypothetical protein
MFYRVVNGIRERQLSNSSSLGDEGGDNDGVMITTTTTTHESLEDVAAHFQPTKDTSDVTPFASANKASPHKQADRRHAEQGFLNQPQQESTGVDPDGDGWSISGYEEMLEAPILGMVPESTLPIVEDDEAEDEEDCVFSMEL